MVQLTNVRYSMPENLTPEEKQKKSDDHDALIKHVFDNLRNLFLCITLAFAGVVVAKYRADLVFGSTIDVIIGLLITSTALGLMFWNAYHGIQKLILPVKGTRKALRLVPFVVLYAFSIIPILQSALLLKADEIRPISKGVSLSSKLKPDAPKLTPTP